MVTLAGIAAAGALEIEMTDVGATAMSSEQLDAFEEAAALWEAQFDDPITVHLDIAFDDLDAGILGSTRTARTSCPFDKLRAALVSDADDGTEEAAVDALPATRLPLVDTNGARDDDRATLSTANAKALGLGTGLDTTYPNPPVGVDGEITFNTDFSSSFDYDPSDGISLGTTDFVAVAAHEIGHALGFYSLTDTQDGNASFTLHPSSLDLWRFPDTDGSHSVGSDSRRLFGSPAEYYDSVLNNVDLSHGVSLTDPACSSTSGACQASHWQDDLGHLMDPTLATDVLQGLDADDLHAVDYIGYDRIAAGGSSSVHEPREFLTGWFPLERLNQLPLPGFGGAFDAFPAPPTGLEASPEATLAMRVGIDFGVPGLGHRSGLGWARFEVSRPIQPELVRPAPDVEGEVNQGPPGLPLLELPDTLSELSFESDPLSGAPFTFTSRCAVSGCWYEPGIGPFGGYRIPGVLDGKNDLVEGDVDAAVTLLLHADPSGRPNPSLENVFRIGPNGSDDALIVYDPQALGTPPCPGADVTVRVDPLQPGPILVPPRGGSFDYRISITNASTAVQSVDAWFGVGDRVTRGPFPLVLQPGETRTRVLSQLVPGSAPAGVQSLYGRVGSFDDREIVCESLLPFDKQ